MTVDTEETRVRFGPKEWHTIPVQWAELILMEMRRTRAKQFGDLLAWAANQDGDGK